jgi:hypothetical protein
MEAFANGDAFSGESDGLMTLFLARAELARLAEQ